MEQPAPSASIRGETYKGLLRAAEYNKANKSFTFRIGKRAVCEAAFLIISGCLLTRNKSDAWGQWIRIRAARIKECTDGITTSSIAAVDQSDRTDTFTRKRGHAIAYINLMASIFGDTTPTADFAINNDVKVLPYDSINSLFAEYRDCYKETMLESNLAGATTFTDAFNSLKTKVKLLGCKGSFCTCEICNVSNEMLRNSKRWNEAQRRVILEYKREHLRQQALERQELENEKALCQQLDAHGQPKKCLIYPDGMTVFKGNTPKLGKKSGRSSTPGSNIIQNRVIGVEVYCGRVAGTMLYHTDNFVSDGGSIMIEVSVQLAIILSYVSYLLCFLLQVIRQAQLDVALLLWENHQQRMPRKLLLQFDNCGNNKNKEMMCYLSLLIEMKYFDECYMNFLIVGHTHSSIDQYFSVLGHAIDECEFICTPLAFQSLVQFAHNGDAIKERPIVNKQIRVYYDMTAYFEPYVNKKIAFYQVPHQFRFYALYGKAVMQYKAFSSHKTWLPEPPVLNVKDLASLKAAEVTMIALQPLITVGGCDSFTSSIGVNNSLRHTI